MVEVTERMIPLIEPLILPSYSEEVQRQILSGNIGPGERTAEFARKLAVYVGASYALLTVSGTVALSVAAHALGLRPGDEILLPAYGVISTINAFSSIGLLPRLVEIDPSTGCMDPEHLRTAVSHKTKAVCFVNFSGYTGENLLAIQQICSEKNIPLIEDAACALGHCHQGTYAGLFGTVGIYSFSVPKVLTTGQGGALVTQDPALFQRAAAFIDQGDLEWRKTTFNRGIGSNLRFNDILAAFGLAQLKDLEKRLAHRKSLYAALQRELGKFLFSVPGQEAPLHNIVFTKEPEKLISFLQQNGIAASRPYRTISSHPAYHHLEGVPKPFPHADFWTMHAVYLPFGMKLTLEDISTIARAIQISGVELLNL